MDNGDYPIGCILFSDPIFNHLGRHINREGADQLYIIPAIRYVYKHRYGRVLLLHCDRICWCWTDRCIRAISVATDERVQPLRWATGCTGVSGCARPAGADWPSWTTGPTGCTGPDAGDELCNNEPTDYDWRRFNPSYCVSAVYS